MAEEPGREGQIPEEAGNPRAIAALVVGILSVVTFIPGPIAWWLGVAGRRRVEAGTTTEHYNSAVAGQTLGIVGTSVVLLYGLLALLAMVAD